MKLLLDQNLSRKLVPILDERFPGSAHVVDFDLERSPDAAVWERAKDAGFVIVSKDTDFYQRSLLVGFPPKVIWLGMGNASSQRVLDALLESAAEIEVFGADDEQSLMVLR